MGADMNTLHDTFAYSSEQQEELIKFINTCFQHDETNIILKKGNKFDKAVMYLANAWTRYENNQPEVRNDIHMLQHRLVMSTIGAIANQLSEEEWDKWTDFVNIELANLRTFNGSFLGLLWKRKQLSDGLADVVNLFGWYFSMYYNIGNSAYQILRPRIITDKSSDDFIIPNQIMTILQLNMVSFIKHFNLNQKHMEFVKIGFEILSKRPTNLIKSWQTYYDSQDNQKINDLLHDPEFQIELS